MININNLPPKVTFGLLINILNLTHTDKISAYIHLLELAESELLNLYFDTETHAVPIEQENKLSDKNTNLEAHYYYSGDLSTYYFDYSKRKKIIDSSLDPESSIIEIGKFTCNDHTYIVCEADTSQHILYKSSVSLLPAAIYADLEELKNYLDSSTPLPSYLDKSHKYYSAELDLAIQLHQAIYMDNYGNPNQSREERVRSWLKMKEVKTSEVMIKRLSTVISTEK